MKALFLTVVIFMVGCITTGKSGYVETKSGEKTEFQNAAIVNTPDFIWVFGDEKQLYFENRDITKFHSEVSSDK